MSLSQKHAGKVLVPWFSKNEWKLVYDLIYSEEKNWPKALAILKIWKLRTQHLSAGVEGTLILLEALLVDTNKSSSFEISHIYSTSLMRFLNLCAANNTKQGTFYKTAMKNKLPKWLISVRHDIAHSHKVPALSMLDLSLKFCLDWIHEMYWNIQVKHMSDLIISKQDYAHAADVIYISIRLTRFPDKARHSLAKRIDKIIKQSSKRKWNNKKIIRWCINSLKKSCKNNEQGVVDTISQQLIDNFAILSTEIDIDYSGQKIIPSKFLNEWQGFLQILDEINIIPQFISQLFKFVCDDSNDMLYREIASVWISEFFKRPWQSMKKPLLISEILDKVTPFTLNFLREVLEFNNAPAEFLEDSILLISAAINCEGETGDKIVTLDDLDINFMDLNEEGLEKQTQSESRWTMIEDTSAFTNLPLGILPNQSFHINPVLNNF